MPRQARQKSENGVYHIMLRGINKQTIFKEDEDYLRFLSTVEKYKEISGYKVYAYCLMPNHIHILLKTEKEDIDLIMKRIAGSYVYWYNWKYSRSGHLFQDRFKSEPVDDDVYFLTVLRYIHQNPIKAKIVNDIKKYRYSSYNDYINDNHTFIDIEFALSILNKESFIEFNIENNEDVCMDIDSQSFRLSDYDAKKIIEEICSRENIIEISTAEKSKLEKLIKRLREKGLSIRQINRLTGIKLSTIRK